MKKILLVSICFLFVSCGSNYYLKRAKMNTLKAIAKGANIDSLKTILHDSIFTTSVHDSLIRETKIDTVTLRELCPEVKTPEKKKKLQQAVCPNVSLDSVYSIPVSVAGKKYDIKIHLQASSVAGKISYNLDIPGDAIPYDKTMISTDLKPGKAPTWFHLIIAAIGALVVGVVVGKLLK